MQRALALAGVPGQALGSELLSTRLHGVLEPIEAATIEGESPRESLAHLEAWLIRRTLERADGRRAETAASPRWPRLSEDEVGAVDLRPAPTTDLYLDC